MTGTDEIDRLLSATQDEDGVAPFSEAFLRGLRDPALGHTHLERREDGVLASIAALAPDGSVELAVHPEFRRQGHGRALVQDVLERDDDANFWAHGDVPAAQALATALGMHVVRELLVMGVEGEELCAAAQPEIPAGMDALNYPAAVERFGVDKTLAAWLEVNNDAFSWHPEQGGWDLERLRRATDTDWFDPAGVWFLFEGERLAGFHWTKRHPEGVGEVYVIGLSSAFRRRGLGGPLLSVGLKHLVDGGSQQVILYVEADNEPAVRRYAGMGFSVRERHVVYRRSSVPQA